MLFARRVRGWIILLALFLRVSLVVLPASLLNPHIPPEHKHPPTFTTQVDGLDVMRAQRQLVNCAAHKVIQWMFGI